MLDPARPSLSQTTTISNCESGRDLVRIARARLLLTISNLYYFLLPSTSFFGGVSILPSLNLPRFLWRPFLVLLPESHSSPLTTLMEKARDSPPLDRVPPKPHPCLRFVSFNINGGKSLFNYHPWNQLRTYDNLADALHADIVSLQELKIQADAVAHVGLVDRYRAFVSVPREKKGYSGVVLFVRIPTAQDLAQLRQALTVIKAEEGVTGRTKPPNPGWADLQPPLPIGGYLDDQEVADAGLDEAWMERLDSEGRCVAVELANGTVVFSLYCPANSIVTEEGEEFRIAFLDVLLRRCHKLHQMGKNVVVMGDINVSMDLIDSAEGISMAIKEKRVTNNLRDGPEAFETLNRTQCLLFRHSRPHRKLLNSYVLPLIEGEAPSEKQIFHDTTRLIQKRRLAMYTVWNTLTGARQANFGSRIDLILTSNAEFARNVVNADILPFLYGSDHSPIFTDVDVSYQQVKDGTTAPKLPFEARTFYKLVKHRDISTMFARPKDRDDRRKSTEVNSAVNTTTGAEEELRAIPLETLRKPARKQSPRPYETRKKQKPSSQQSIRNFFFSDAPKLPDSTTSITTSTITHEISAPDSKSVRLDSIESLKSLVYSDPPACKHEEPCILKTSLTKINKGRRFWCCSRDGKGNPKEIGEFRCDFFEWARPNGM